MYTALGSGRGLGSPDVVITEPDEQTATLDAVIAEPDQQTVIIPVVTAEAAEPSEVMR
jgi:hypothetical protein